MLDRAEIQAFLDHIRLEHLHVEESLKTLAAHMQVLRTQTRHVLEQLELFRCELADHFRSEDEGGCMEEAVSRNPAVGPLADVVAYEHEWLLAELDQLREAVAEHRWSAAESAFEDFRRNLLQHEQRENEILSRAFNVCVDDTT